MLRKKLRGCLIHNYEEDLEGADWVLKTQLHSCPDRL